MELTIQLPEPVGRELLRLPDPDAFVGSAVAKALEERRVTSPRRADGTPGVRGATRTGRRLDPSEVRELDLPRPKTRDRELAWRRSHQEMLRDRFAGQWLVLEGEEIVAHSKDAAQAVAEARAKGIPTPFVFFVEGLRPDVVRMGL